MKKLVVLLLGVGILLTGCGKLELSKSKTIVNTTKSELSDLDTIDSETLTDLANDSVDMEAVSAIDVTLDKYLDIIGTKTDEINAAGGATGRTYELGNETIDLANELISEYNDNVRYGRNVEDFYGQLIVLRGNLEELGWI